MRGLRPPVLLFYGTVSAPFEGIIGNRLKELRPDLQITMVERASHNVHRDRPDIVNSAILAFLAS